ncbi:cation:proton antiporter [Candidatus Bathyarchaeota archaeon]|nr:cation:proton antiporter [Candidatus Bathyarchaeota archaeon]
MVTEILLILGISVIISVIGHGFFEKTGTPESIFLLIFGLILGPGIGFIRPSDIENLVPFVFTLSIIIILLESGLSTSLSDLFETMKVSTFFTCMVLLITTLLCSLFFYFLLKWDLFSSIIIGVISSGTSTLPIMYFINRMEMDIKVTQLLVFESIINDVTILTSVAIILQIMTLKIEISNIITNIILYLIVAVIYGLLFSLGWVYILIKFFDDLQLKYILTLAVAVILYSIVESHGGSGVISVMVFGISVNNLPNFFTEHGVIAIKTKNFFTHIQVMQDEITFFVKNIFFLIMGLLFDIRSFNNFILLISISLIVLMVLSRLICVIILGKIDSLYNKYIWKISLMLPRGLTAGLAAVMPIEKGINIPYLKDLVIFLVLLTNITATVGFMSFIRMKNRIE